MLQLKYGGAMEYDTNAPPVSNIDRSAVDIHMPPPEMIAAIIVQAAQYERSFLYPEVVKDPAPELVRRAMGWIALN